MINLQYTYKMQEFLNCEADSIALWINSIWLNEIEIEVIESLLALAND